jgi:hypothetical protein
MPLISRDAGVLTAALLASLWPSQLYAGPPTVFINEIHYDNSGTDVNEFVEIAGPAGTDLTGWSIELYSSGSLYDTDALSGTIPDQQNGFGTLAFAYPLNGLQNGPNDGLALVNPAMQVVELLSYEGTFLAANGTAAGLTSTDIGVVETGSDPPGLSLALAGFGVSRRYFGWTGPQTATPGQVNVNQTFLRTLQVKIRKIGDHGAAGSGFVELQMYAPGQTDVSGHRLHLYGPGATLLDTYIFSPNSSLDGTNQRRVLISQSDPDQDFGFGSMKIQGEEAAALCFDDTDCVAWGAFGPTDGLPSPVGSPAPNFENGALIRSIAPGCPTLLEAMDDTNDSATDFAPSDRTRHNNASPITETGCDLIFRDGFE